MGAAPSLTHVAGDTEKKETKGTRGLPERHAFLAGDTRKGRKRKERVVCLRDTQKGRKRKERVVCLSVTPFLEAFF